MPPASPPRASSRRSPHDVEISPSMWSQIKSARPIGDKLARQIEQHAASPPAGSTRNARAAGLTPGEQQFLALALQAWRAPTPRRASG